MTKEYHVRLSTGMGDLILSYDILSQSNYDKIYYSLEKELTIPLFDQNMYNSRCDFAKKIFTDNKFVFTEDQNYEWIPWFNLVSRLNIWPKFREINQFDGPSVLINKPYIVFQTKVRDFFKDVFYNLYLEKVKELLNILSNKYTIILIGERNLLDHEENRYHNKTLFNIYQDINNSIFLDYTYPDWPSLTNWDRILRDSALLRGCTMSIGFGFGGGFVLSVYNADKSFLFSDINMKDYKTGIHVIFPIIVEMFDRNGQENHKQFFDFDSFRDKILRAANILPSYEVHG